MTVLRNAVAIAAMICGAVTAALASETAERLTSKEILAYPSIEAGPGTSGVSGMRTILLLGDPSKPGIYTIQIMVPPHTLIQAHRHRDDRAATVVSGMWYIGYGPRRKDSLLKALPPGSFYTEPAGAAHFAGTKDQPAIVRITGFGPSDTTYVDASEDPANVSASH